MKLKKASRIIDNRNPIAAAWLAVGGLLALGFAVLTIMEIPSMRREANLMRM
ncbi:MAG TPA: hypothetical protein VFC07_12815 [Verrucomicrobiae bacterium]|nr:hypothetical protein [Verrucomicrobiae bacterium]